MSCTPSAEEGEGAFAPSPSGLLYGMSASVPATACASSGFGLRKTISPLTASPAANIAVKPSLSLCGLKATPTRVH